MNTTATTKAAKNSHTFTLSFKRGEIALLEIRGAENIEQARLIASTAIAHCFYGFMDGCQVRGHVAIFYLWCSTAAQQHQPIHTSQLQAMH